MDGSIDRTAGNLFHLCTLGVLHPNAPTLKAADRNDKVWEGSICTITMHCGHAVQVKGYGAENSVWALLFDKLCKYSSRQWKIPRVLQKPMKWPLAEATHGESFGAIVFTQPGMAACAVGGQQVKQLLYIMT